MKTSVSARAVGRALIPIVLILGVAVPVRGQALPSPWTSADIGAPALSGEASSSAGVFTIDAAGLDIWGSSDQFHFVYQAIAGDIDVRARIDDVTFAHEWSKVGVMIRASLSAGSAHGTMFASADEGVAFQRRPSTGALSRHTAGGLLMPPRWVRIVRQGSTLTAYHSSNGSTWTLVGSDTVTLGATAYVGIAVTSHNASMRTTAHVSNVLVTSLGSAALPAGQSSADIGAPAVRGSTTHSNGTYTIKGAGTDIWGSADQFQYLYQQMNGDGSVVARVGALTNSDLWAKTGVMIRETLAANSRHASAFVTAAKGYAFQRRLEPATWTDHTAGGAGAAPGWVRLVRAGSTFTASRSADGVNWTTIGSASINMGSSVYAGIAITSHNASVAATATVDGFRVTETGPVVNKPPVVSLTAPSTGSTYTAPATVTMTASASDPEARMAAVEFYSGGTMIARDTTAPYAFSWGSVAAGTYTLTAVATDADGLSTTSAAVSVTVNGATVNKPPVVSVTAPAGGSTFTAPATTTITASASDPEGRMSSVAFYAGATLIGRDTTAPYSVSWASVPAGAYTLTAVATDADGISATSAAVSVTVATATTPTTPPRLVEFMRSADHSTGVTSYLLEIFASGANPTTATPVATSSLGKPTPASDGTITVDRATFFSSLATGGYVATVSAIGPGGKGQGAGVAFTR